MAVKEMPQTSEVTRLMPLYKVLLHNDDVNYAGYVVHVLQMIFSLEKQEADRIMTEAHNSGVALVCVEPLERAELHKDQLQSCNLTSTIEPE